MTRTIRKGWRTLFAFITHNHYCISDVDRDKILPRAQSIGAEVSEDDDCRLQTSSVACRGDQSLRHQQTDQPVNMTTCRRHRSTVDVAVPTVEQHRGASPAGRSATASPGSAAAAAPATRRIWSVVELIRSNHSDDIAGGLV